jgi:hypothetical protein
MLAALPAVLAPCLAKERQAPPVRLTGDAAAECRGGPSFFGGLCIHSLVTESGR